MILHMSLEYADLLLKKHVLLSMLKTAELPNSFVETVEIFFKLLWWMES